MAKKKPATQNRKSKNAKVNLHAEDPQETKRSKGFFYVRPNKKTGSWALYHESWKDAKKHQRKISPAMFADFGLVREMSVEQARNAIREYNQQRKKSLGVSLSQIRALERMQDMKEIDKTFFPPVMVEEFVERLQAGSDGQPRFKRRLVTCFGIVQKMTVTLRLKPYEYLADADRIVSYFKEQRYSVSYCQDVIYVLNKWGAFYSRKKGSFFEPISKLRVKTQNAIAEIQKSKDGVRRPSLPMSDMVLQRLKSKIDNSNLDDLKKFNWVFLSYVFGLRPSECDDAIKAPRIEDHDGIPTLVVTQTKLTVVHEHEREKKIPVVCEEQMAALAILEKGQAKRPSPKWVDGHCKEEGKRYGRSERYDLYCGRKGFIDFMISKGQDLQQASIFAGHKSIDTTWTFYKDRKAVKFNPTKFTDQQFKKPKNTG